jgi:hypothetical protein
MSHRVAPVMSHFFTNKDHRFWPLFVAVTAMAAPSPVLPGKGEA